MIYCHASVLGCWPTAEQTPYINPLLADRAPSMGAFPQGLLCLHLLMGMAT